jgi:hypothetical protein
MKRPKPQTTGAIIVLAAGLWLTTLTGACKSKTPGEYVSAAKGFGITYPADWEVRADQLGLDVIGLSPLTGPADQFRENVTVASTEVPAPLTGEQILEGNLPDMIKMITDFKPLDKGSEQINGIAAAWMTYTMLQGKMRLTVKLYAVPGPGRAHLIHCYAETASASTFQLTFDQIVRSFKVRP